MKKNITIKTQHTTAVSPTNQVFSNCFFPFLIYTEITEGDDAWDLILYKIELTLLQ